MTFNVDCAMFVVTIWSPISKLLTASHFSGVEVVNAACGCSRQHSCGAYSTYPRPARHPVAMYLALKHEVQDAIFRSYARNDGACFLMRSFVRPADCGAILARQKKFVDDVI